jgi:hypothetical protein
MEQSSLLEVNRRSAGQNSPTVRKEAVHYLVNRWLQMTLVLNKVNGVSEVGLLRNFYLFINFFFIISKHDIYSIVFLICWFKYFFICPINVHEVKNNISVNFYVTSYR